MKTAHQSSGDQALNRALDLLKAVITDDGRQPASRLAAALDLAPSTARRMMASLCRHGLVERIGHGHYAAGPGLAGLAAYTRPHRKLIEAARPLLRALAREEKLTAHLGLFQNDMVTYLVKEGGGNLFTQESAQLEAYCTGIGKALLARLPDAELEHYLKGNFIALTPYTLTTPEALRKEIKQVRGRGYALDNREMDENVACVAVSIDWALPTPAALSVTGNPATFPLDQASRLVNRLRNIAARIANRLEKDMAVSPSPEQQESAPIV
ncbi:MAG: IclR family transcriptional regulator [Sphingobium sp.]|jgi:IclR family acetate operon transcriptional repressor|nr:IclR family transcriptional regulator [Sphingobium sp.]MCI1271165.1 IclR family transcriptional regulator [Sphingobium sp.]MCI1754797.1 IclR family transcriptional regulator [Sphingobium sp.]MCI2053029.1 IclR family transcriptional regulator [Sphingobium sp.]